jgi:hypothetical protein
MNPQTRLILTVRWSGSLTQEIEWVDGSCESHSEDLTEDEISMILKKREAEDLLHATH